VAPLETAVVAAALSQRTPAGNRVNKRDMFGTFRRFSDGEALAALEGLDDDHAAAAVGANLRKGRLFIVAGAVILGSHVEQHSRYRLLSRPARDLRTYF
jgi:hypothetical protein